MTALLQSHHHPLYARMAVLGGPNIQGKPHWQETILLLHVNVFVETIQKSFTFTMSQERGINYLYKLIPNGGAGGW